MLINKVDKKVSGFSLIELLAVVGIGGALIAGALLLINNVNAKKEIKQNSENISAVYANMETLFSDEVLTGVSMDDLIVSGVFPSTLKIASPNVKNTNGGIVRIVPGTDGYTLEYAKMKQAACVEVLKNQKRVGWDTWNVTIGTTVSGTPTALMTTANIRNFAAACGDSTDDWVSLQLRVAG